MATQHRERWFDRFRNVRRRATDTTGLFAELHRRHGDAASFPMLGKRYTVFFDPMQMEEALIGHHECLHKGREQKEALENPCLVTADGEDHQWRRKLIQPSFTPKALRSYAGVMTDDIVMRRDRIDDGDLLDMNDLTHEIALSIAARTFFGEDLEDVTPTVIKEALAGYRWLIMLSFLPMRHFFRALPLPKSIAAKKAIRRLDDSIYAAIRRIRAAGKEGGELVSHLVHSWEKGHPRGTFTEAEVKDEVVAVLIAGHESTAAAMAWSFYHLSRNPEARECLEREVDEVLGGRAPGFDDVPKLPYIGAVVDETMRVTPSVAYLDRVAVKDITIGGTRVRKGDGALFNTMTPMHSAKYFPEPERFLPERWLEPKARKGRPRYAYAPFGSGPRLCSGFRFSRIQLVLALAIMAQRWRFDLLSSEEPPVFDLVIYKFKGALDMRARAREAPSLAT